MKPLFTRNGHDFFVVSSLLQKSLRRGDVIYAAWAANELLPKYANYVWNRLMTVSAEDCAEMVTGEVMALHHAWRKVNERDRDRSRGRVFVAKAIVLLAKAKHSRDADELNILVSDRLPEAEVTEALADAMAELEDPTPGLTVPEYVYDVHTRQGKRAGKTKQDFMIEEHEALTDPSSIFGNFAQMVESDTYVQPELDFDPGRT